MTPAEVEETIAIASRLRVSTLYFSNRNLDTLPESISNLTNLTELHLENNQLTNLPKSLANLTNLNSLDINGNPLTDLSMLKNLQQLKSLYFLGVHLPDRYWTKFSDWKPEWLLDEENIEIRRTLIERVGYERICDELNAVTLDTWREYTLLIIDGIETIYDGYHEPKLDREPMVLLKMTCPSTAYLHILRVPPEMKSAEEAITWVNHGIHPDDFAVQT